MYEKRKYNNKITKLQIIIILSICEKWFIIKSFAFLICLNDSFHFSQSRLMNILISTKNNKTIILKLHEMY